jgi:hypothetical protein
MAQDSKKRPAALYAADLIQRSYAATRAAEEQIKLSITLIAQSRELLVKTRELRAHSPDPQEGCEGPKRTSEVPKSLRDGDA